MRVKDGLLSGGFVGDGLSGEEVGGEALGVGGEELFDAIARGGAHDKAGVMKFVDAFGDFRIGVGGRVGFLLAGE